MAILRPDSTSTLGGVTVKEYLLTKHNPNRIDMPSASMAGKIIGVTVHNTDWISVVSGTTPAEQYTRATVNGNMNDVRVHYYVDNTCAWQNLPLTLSGWHAADGSGNGNRKTIAIECIMSYAYNATDKKSEDNCARLAAALLKQYGLGISHLYTHTHWLNVRDGKSGTVDQLNTIYLAALVCFQGEGAILLERLDFYDLNFYYFTDLPHPKNMGRCQVANRSIFLSGKCEKGLQFGLLCFRFFRKSGLHTADFFCERSACDAAKRSAFFFRFCKNFFQENLRYVLHL